MKQIRYKLSIDICSSELNLLLKSLEYFNLSSACLNYGEEIEECQELRHKMFRSLTAYSID